MLLFSLLQQNAPKQQLKKGFILACSLRVLSTVVGKAQEQELVAIGLLGICREDAEK